jgi:hypothetical protein
MTLSRFINECNCCKAKSSEIGVYDKKIFQFNIFLRDQWYFKTKEVCVTEVKDTFFYPKVVTETMNHLPPAPTEVLET